MSCQPLVFDSLARQGPRAWMGTAAAHSTIVASKRPRRRRPAPRVPQVRAVCPEVSAARIFLVIVMGAIVAAIAADDLTLLEGPHAVLGGEGPVGRRHR